MEEFSLTREGIRYWAKKGGLAVLDQGLFSGANFIVNILLARWLPPKEYGAFAVALSIFYLLAGFHTAVLTEPMMVFGAGKYREQFRKYLGMLLYGHFGISIIISLALGVAALVVARYGSDALARALGGLALSSPFLLLLWLTRRGCYVHLRPIWALIGSAVNLVVVLAGIFPLWRGKLLTPLTGLVLLGCAAGVASLLNLFHLRPQITDFITNPTPAAIRDDHWKYGKWILLESFAYSLSGHLLVIIIPLFLGLVASASFAAVMNLYRPIHLITQGVSLMLLPTFSAWAREGESIQRLSKRAVIFGTILAVSIGTYGLLLFLTWEPLAQWVFSGKYIGLSLLAGVIGFGYALNAIGYSTILVMKATLRLKAVPFITGVSGIVTVVFAVPLMMMFGVLGVALSFVFGRTVFLCLGLLRTLQWGKVEGGSFKKIAFAVPLSSRPRGGYWWGTLEHLSRGYNIDLVLGAGPGFDLKLLPGALISAIQVFVLSGSKFIRIPLVRSHGQYDFGVIIPPIFEFMHYLFTRKPDVIFVSGFSVWSFIAVFLKPIGKWKVIVMYDGSSPSVDRRDSKWITLWRKLIAVFADAAISNTRRGGRYLEECLRMKPEKIFIHPYEVPNFNTSIKIRRDKVDNDGKLIFAFVGRLIPQKGVHHLIDAISILDMRNQNKKFQVLIIGDGPQRQELEQKVQKLGLQERIQFLGWIDSERLASILETTDVFVFPTLEDVWGVAPLEAMALGKPVLCSKHAGAAELISEGREGWTFDPYNPKKLAVLMEQFLEKPMLINEMGQNAAQKMKRYTPQSAAAFLKTVIERVAQ